MGAFSWPRRPIAAAVCLLVVAALLVAGVAGPPEPATPTPTDRPTTDTPATGPPATAEPLGIDEAVDVVHARGVTGRGVAVGVIDVTGYDRGHPRLDEVEATRAFGPDVDARSGGRYTHGTAAAASVAAVAPDAELYLATVATPRGFRRAVEWLLDRGVDVVVAPVTFYGKPDDGSAAAVRTVDRATDRGVVFVAPAGNLAQSRWTGVYRPAANATAPGEPPGDRPRLRFGDDARNGVRGDRDRFVLWLSWPRERRGENYTALLYREGEGGAELVARSTPYGGDAVPNERVEARLTTGERYFVVVQGPDRPTGTALELESPTHRLDHATATGSVAAPATARDALVVGATEDGRPAPYTSRGPTRDGRPGIDVAAPGRPPPSVDRGRYVGSSLSAPRVAGLAALLLSVRPGLAPAGVEGALELTAVDVGRPGYDFAAGHGRVAPVRAVRFVAG